MKKIFLTLSKGVIPFAVLISSAHAQQAKDKDIKDKDTVVYAKNEKNVPQMKDANAPANTANINADNMNIISKKAIKNFKTDAKKAEAVNWYKIQDGFVAYYREDGIQHKAYYSKNGNWCFTIKNYDEMKLPKEVRATVKSTYYDFSIFGVQEIHVEDKIVYLVHIKDDTTIKTVRVCDGEMEEIESFKNAQ